VNHLAPLTARLASLLCVALTLTPAWSSSPTKPLHAALRDIVLAQDSGLASSNAEWKASRRAIARLLAHSRVPRRDVASLGASIRRSMQADPVLFHLWQSVKNSPRSTRTAMVEKSLALVEAHLRTQFPAELSALESASIKVYQLDL